MRSRLINRRQQGDLGEASAIEWLTRQGATVLIPFGHSPDYDLVADVDGRLLRVQVKTSTSAEVTPNGYRRYQLQIATNGGNQSWSGVAKRFDPGRFDLLFALVADGRRWLIPTTRIEAETNMSLAGPKYSEFEIEPGQAIDHLVYGEEMPTLESDAGPGEYPSGQRTRSVKPPAYCLRRFESCLPHSPPGAPPAPRFKPTKYERKPGQRSVAVINQKRRVTLPQKALLEAGLRDGDRVRARADGLGRIVLEKAGLPVWAEAD
jgi:Holliday junction resolvase-like predicted endonuclease